MLKLPEQPSLEQLRKQAKELQRANPDLSLADAQRDLARSYGFASWNKLKQHVETTSGLRTHVSTFVEHALGGRLELADQLLRESPSLYDSPAVSALLGNLSAVEKLDPLVAIEPKGWVPLLYVCYSRYYSRPALTEKLVSCAKSLLDRGADANASYEEPSFPELPETCLYGAVGRASNAELTRILLDHGANPNDGEALYHGTEFANHEPLRLVLKTRGSSKGFNCLAHMLDREDLKGLEMVLESYGSPDDDLSSCLHHAIIRQRSVSHLEQLVDHGADPLFIRDGVSALMRARLMRNRAASDLLASRVSQEPSPVEKYLVALVEGDESVDALPVPPELQWVLAAAAGHNEVGIMRRMLDAGFDPDVIAGWGQTGLHMAGWMGFPEPVSLLLDRGASLAVKDLHHQGTPLNFTIAGAAWGANPSGNHLSAARLMLEHGAKEHCSPDFIRGLVVELPEMRSLLGEFGI
ncbi:ankyrin repeat domain-containing protein [soil metagenome]